MNFNFTSGVLVAKVRELAAAHPDNVYGKTDMFNKGCSYVAGKCSDGSCGCIIGQALIALGVDRNLLQGWESNHEMTGALHLLPEEWEGANWCDQVQACQDRGETWSSAVATADRFHALGVSYV